jgi:hypothetical protein
VELERQTAKIVAAMKGLDADVLGLIELENDGDGATSAIQDLVDALNAEMGAGTYAHIADPATGAGTDEIKVGLIYRPAAVTPVARRAATPRRSTTASRWRRRSRTPPVLASPS